MKIGPYHVIQELGRGGMAQVLLAHRVWEDGKRRSCVLKCPRLSVVTDAGILRQFIEESRLAILLRHNNIVSVFDVGVHEGLPYIVMDYIAGKDLSQMVKAAARLATPFDSKTAIHVVREVGQALLHAHEFEYNGVPQRIVHRDVASKNVMMDGSGGVLLMDFGVATSLHTQTSRMHVKGTLPYMAPEHYLGQAGAISDVFGLGAILWELLAGRPFRAGLEGQPLIAAVVSGAVDPVERELPEDVRRVLDGMLEPDASRRMTLREVLSILEDYPSRRMALREMMSEFFGRAGKRTGLSQIHFAASKELVDTLAVVKVAGVSLSGLQRRKRWGHPEEIPVDFVPRAKKDSTARVHPLADDAGLDDDLDDEVGAVPPASDIDSAAGARLANDGAPSIDIELVGSGEPASGVELANGSEPASDVEPVSAITELWRTPRGTVRAPRTPAPVPEQALGARVHEAQRTGDVTPSVTEPPATSQQPKDRWSPSGDTLRSPDSPEPKGPPPPATMRLQASIVMGLDAPAAARGIDPSMPTAFHPPPVTEPNAPSPHEAGSTSEPEASTAIPANAQRFTAPVAAASTGMAAGYTLDAGAPPSSPRVGTESSPVSVSAPATRGQGTVLLVAVMVLVVGVGTWFLWPEAMTRPRYDVEHPSESSVAMANTAPVPVTAPSEPATPEDVVEPESVEVEEALAAGAGMETAVELEPEATAGMPTLAEPNDEPEPSIDPSVPVDEPAPAPEPAPASEPAPAKPAPVPKADEDPVAKAKPRAPKPVPKVELVMRRGLMVDFAEIRVGRGKAQTVPTRGSLTVYVTPGTYTLRYRTKPDTDWRSIRWPFSSNTKYSGRLEQSGLFIGAIAGGGQ